MDQQGDRLIFTENEVLIAHMPQVAGISDAIRLRARLRAQKESLDSRLMEVRQDPRNSVSGSLAHLMARMNILSNLESEMDALFTQEPTASIEIYLQQFKPES